MCKELCNYEQNVATRTKVAYMIQTNGNHPVLNKKLCTEIMLLWQRMKRTDNKIVHGMNKTVYESMQIQAERTKALCNSDRMKKIVKKSCSIMSGMNKNCNRVMRLWME